MQVTLWKSTPWAAAMVEKEAAVMPLSKAMDLLCLTMQDLIMDNIHYYISSENRLTN